MTREEAPEKIYISNFDIEALPKNEQLSERWHEVSTQDTDIEYTRTDAFIEKACEFLFENYHGEKLSLRMIEDFKKYMEEYV